MGFQDLALRIFDGSNKRIRIKLKCLEGAVRICHLRQSLLAVVSVSKRNAKVGRDSLNEVARYAIVEIEMPRSWISYDAQTVKVVVSKLSCIAVPVHD